MKQSGYDFGRTKQTTQGDTELLIEIRQWLLQNFKIVARREHYIGFSQVGHIDFVREYVDRTTAEKYRGRIRNPDLYFTHREYGMFVIEVDGSIHDYKVEKTRQRNNQYILAGIKLIVINLRDLKEYKMSIPDFLSKSLETWKITSTLN